jgi:hypothetical protein
MYSAASEFQNKRSGGITMRKLKPMLVGGALTVASFLLTSSLCFGQDDDRAAAAGLIALLSGMLFFILIFAAVFYVYFALALQTIAKKTNTENAWLAWIPIVNVILLLNIAKKPVWWIIFFIVPILNIAGIVLGIILWMKIAEVRGRPDWWGILMIVPVVNLVVLGLLAWSDATPSAPAVAPTA